MGEGIPIVLSREKLLLIELAAFFCLKFFHYRNRGDLKRKRAEQPLERDRQWEAVETISAQVFGLGEITSMSSNRKGQER